MGYEYSDLQSAALREELEQVKEISNNKEVSALCEMVKAQEEINNLRTELDRVKGERDTINDLHEARVQQLVELQEEKERMEKEIIELNLFIQAKSYQ